MDSERNRPTRLRTPEHVPSEAERAWRSAYEDLVSTGRAPERVADLVVEAVRSRMETILEQRNPQIVLPDEIRGRLKF